MQVVSVFSRVSRALIRTCSVLAQLASESAPKNSLVVAYSDKADNNASLRLAGVCS